MTARRAILTVAAICAVGALCFAGAFLDGEQEAAVETPVTVRGCSDTSCLVDHYSSPEEVKFNSDVVWDDTVSTVSGELTVGVALPGEEGLVFVPMYDANGVSFFPRDREPDALVTTCTLSVGPALSVSSPTTYSLRIDIIDSITFRDGAMKIRTK